MKRCEVCRGREEITLPLFSDPSASFDHAVIGDAEIAETKRTFPCPQCTPTTDESRVAILTYSSELRSDFNVAPDALKHIRQSLSRTIAELMAKQGNISFACKPDTNPQFGRDTSLHSATVGVVSPGHVASMQERINERQMEVAEMVATEAAKRISNWGSEYHDNSGPITKDTAMRQVRDALLFIKENTNE